MCEKVHAGSISERLELRGKPVALAMLVERHHVPSVRNCGLSIKYHQSLQKIQALLKRYLD